MKHRMIRLALTYAKLLNQYETSRAGMRRLFQAIQRTVKFTNQSKLPLSNKARWLLHINLLL